MNSAAEEIINVDDVSAMFGKLVPGSALTRTRDSRAEG